jgi:hypothetical protein
MGDIFLVFGSVTGVHYNLENIIVSFMQVKDKGYAFACILPYAQFFAMMFTSSYSQLYSDYPIYFIILCGFYLTWVTAIFNLNSTSGAKFNWLFFEPFVYLVIVYLDYNKTMDYNTALYCYSGFFLYTMVSYLMLMNNIVQQITTHMNLRFLLVKPTNLTKQE